ncbi:MAG: hypothetical protein K1X85_07670 [Ignavibacteria bacterium]|nr:hypothetical protein [Ignavibacteria bacterium]
MKKIQICKLLLFAGFLGSFTGSTAMAMCLDIIIREKSNGKRSLLSMMGGLSEIYGPPLR